MIATLGDDCMFVSSLKKENKVTVGVGVTLSCVSTITAGKVKLNLTYHSVNVNHLFELHSGGIKAAISAE